MKKNIRIIVLLMIVFLSSMALGISVSAESYQFDVSGSKPTEGNWAQAFTEYTPLEGKGENEYHFNPLWMTPQSEIIAEFRYEGETSMEGDAPIELIWQTWDGPAEKPEGAKNWAKVAPASHTDTTATFTYADIVAAYGTDDFSTVYAVNIGDTGTKLTLLSLTCTNIDRSQVPAPEVAVPQHETSADAAQIAANAPDEGGSIGIIIGVAAAIVAVVLIVAAVVVFLGKHNNKSY